MRQVVRTNIRLLIVLIMMVCNMVITSGGDVGNVSRAYGITNDSGYTEVFLESIAYRDDMPNDVRMIEVDSPIGDMLNPEMIQDAINIVEYLEEQERLAEEERLRQEQLRLQQEAEEAERKRIEEEKRKIEEQKKKRIDYINNINNPTHINQSSNLSLEHMREILKHTGLVGTEYAFHKLDKQGINFFFAVGVSIQETGWKTNSNRARTRNDVFGITSVNRYYKSKQDCIYYFGDFMQRLYINKGLTTVESINKKYCPSTNEWAPGIRSHMTKLYKIAMDTVPQTIR